MKAAWACSIVAQIALSAESFVAGSVGTNNFETARLGIDIDYVHGRFVAFERGWIHRGWGRTDSGSRLALAYLVAPHVAVAVGGVLTSHGSSPAIGVTVPISRTTLVYGNYLTRSHATDLGMEHQVQLGPNWGAKFSGDVFVIAGTRALSVHGGLYWRLR